MPEDKPRPAPRKKLIEVALPLEAINRESAREKSIRHGHPSTLHLWWARRPLAACRAVLFSSLVDDPSGDPQYRKPDGSIDEERAAEKRAQLFTLIEELVKWENSNEPKVIDAARAEIARCVASRKIEIGELTKETVVFGPEALKGKPHPKGPMPAERGVVTAYEVQLMRGRPDEVNSFLSEFAPPVLDPFCGGGSIPLEAQRLGLRAFGSDLNPVPVLITKALIELPPKFANMPPVNPESRGVAGTSAPVTKGKKKETQGQLGTQSWRGAAGLAEDVRHYGRWMRGEAQKRIGHLYPKITVTEAMARDRKDLKDYIGQELTVIAWLWARTVPSPNPAAGGSHVPLVKSFWVSTKKGKKAWVEPVIAADGKSYKFEVRSGTPQKQDEQAIDGGTKTGRGCNFRCLLSNTPIPEEHIKSGARNGNMDSRLMAIVVEGKRERLYLSPTDAHERIAKAADPGDAAKDIHAPLANDPRALWCLIYGLDHFDKLFTARQLVALTTFSDLVKEVRERVLADSRTTGLALTNSTSGRAITLATTGAAARSNTSAVGTAASDNGDSNALERAEQYADAVATYLAFSISKLSDRCSAICTWFTERDSSRSTFARQGLPMAWDFAELNTLNDGTGTFEGANQWTAEVLDLLHPGSPGQVMQKDAQSAAASFGEAPFVYSTDPPYYDNIGYADLSDFFYVWLRRSLSAQYPHLFRTLLTPKAEELIASPYRHEGGKDSAMTFFETGLGLAFERMRDGEHPDYPLTVFYAFKQAETEDDDGEAGEVGKTTASTGWETMLEGLIKAGFSITGTWPMRTELGNRMVGMGANALASSIVLVCHPRGDVAPMASRREFVSALKRELPAALRDLQSGNIAPVDLAQAAIGPGMAVFSRYAKVLETSGDRMGVRTALALINQVLDEVLAEQEGEYDADTRWCIKWFEQYAHNDGPYGDAETLSKAMAVAVNGLVETGVVAAKSGKVRLFKRADLMGGKPETWDPATDDDILHWEVCQYLCWALETGGEQAAGDLLRRINAVYAGAAEVARDLAYRLYTLCERKKWAQEAISYNALVVAWPEIQKLAAKGPAAAAGTLYS